MVRSTSGLLMPPGASRRKLVRNAAVGAPVTEEYPTLPATCNWFWPKIDVATAKAVPRSGCEPREDSDAWSPADTLTIPRVPEKTVVAALCWAGSFHPGKNRSTGLVAEELRSTHLHSSLMMEDWPGDTATSSME